LKLTELGQALVLSGLAKIWLVVQCEGALLAKMRLPMLRMLPRLTGLKFFSADFG
jgi:hypothetical protein